MIVVQHIWIENDAGEWTHDVTEVIKCMKDQRDMDYIFHILLPVVWADHSWEVIWVPTDGHDLVEITSASGYISIEQERDLKRMEVCVKNLLSIWRNAYKGVKRTVSSELFRWRQAEVHETEDKNDSSRTIVMLLAVIVQHHQPEKAGLYKAWEAIMDLHADPIECTRDRLVGIAITGCLGIDVVVPQRTITRGPRRERAPPER
jgi:hypothetical protein